MITTILFILLFYILSLYLKGVQTKSIEGKTTDTKYVDYSLLLRSYNQICMYWVAENVRYHKENKNV